MTQHKHNALIKQWADDPSQEIIMQLNPDCTVEVSIEQVVNDTAGDYTFRIKPRPHPNDKYREALERGEPVWVSEGGNFELINVPWDFSVGEYEYSLTDPNPADPYAHLRKANEEGRVAWHDNITGEWVLPKDGRNKWVFGNYPPDPDRYKIVEPDEVRRIVVSFWAFGELFEHKLDATKSGLTGKITAKVVE